MRVSMNNKGFSLIELLIVVVIIGILIIILIPHLKESKEVSQETAAIATLRYLASAEASFNSRMYNKRYGTLAELAAQHYIDNRFAGGQAHYDGYSFSSQVTTTHFTILATPDAGTNLHAFYIDDTMALCFANGEPLPHQ